MDTVLDKVAQVRKALVAFVGALVLFLQEIDVLVPDSGWIAGVVTAVTAFLVWLTPNAEA